MHAAPPGSSASTGPAGTTTTPPTYSKKPSKAGREKPETGAKALEEYY